MPAPPLTNITGAAIGVLNQYGDAELTITLEGTNAIEDVSIGIKVRSSGGNAALNITGDGTLVVNSNSNPIIVISSNGNAALGIKNAKVTAKSSYDNGVTVQSGNSENSSASLTVNGGSLTTTAQSSGASGILLRFGTSGTSDGTPTVTVSNNAIVRANGSAGGITSNSSTGVQYGTGGKETGGIIWNGTEGTVYGNVTLQEDLEIGEGESLTLDDGANLSAGDHNVIVDGGTLDESLKESLSDSVKYAPTITAHPQNVEVKENETATFTVNATGSDLSYQWQQSTDNGNSWTNIDSANAAEYTTGQTTMDMNGTQYRCVVKNSVNEVTSDAATLTVTAIPTYSITVQNDGNGTASASAASAPAGTEITLTATPNSGYHFERWEVVPDIITITDNTFPMPAEPVTIQAIFAPDSSGGAYHPEADSSTTSTPDRYEIDKPSNVENGSIKVSPSKAEKGDTVTITVTPDEDYALDELAVYDEDGDEIDLKDKGDGKYTFEMPKGDVEIEVSFAAIEDETAKADFADVASDAWYADAVQYVYENGLMSGTSETTFSPNLTTTRGMIVTTLYRLEGSPDLSDDNLGYPYADVDANAYYADAVYWTRQNGIVAGMSAEQFAPSNAITREQLTAILYRYAQFKGYDVSVGENTNILSYTDFAALDAYAIPAMQWACGAGIITGMSEATLGPDGSATRAQVATILMRFCEEYVNW